ncbi:MAG: hypothetical protein QOK40_596 [Miltoncostaeaceae bacterium]|jgi:hypothetical protein|nr:hypothetical protein [Miltoncostaeaceae bacterium]
MAEDEKERRDRELMELVSELRVALPGVQVLFSFLLIVPFNQRWGRTTQFDHAVYLATLLLAAAASTLLISPSAQHRLLFRRRYEERMLLTANRIAIAGIGCLGLAMIGAVLLVTHVLFGLLPAAVTASCAGLVIGWAWYLLPLRNRDADAE